MGRRIAAQQSEKPNKFGSLIEREGAGGEEESDPPVLKQRVLIELSIATKRGLCKAICKEIGLQ